MIEVILVLFALIIGSIIDIKIREVPDTLNYSLIILGFLLAIASSIYSTSLMPLIGSIGGFLIATSISLLLFYSGQWGGGDAKLLMGIGAIKGLSIGIFGFYFILEFFILTMLAGAIYGVFWMIYLAIKNKDEFIKQYKKLNTKKIIFIKKVMLLISIFIILFSILLNPYLELTILIIALLFTLFFSLYLFLTVKAVENGCMVKKIGVNKLVEGDWVVGSKKLSELKIEVDKTGISKEQIDIIKKNKIKSIVVKEGIPFVPSFLLAYLFILLW
ncbi:MAG: prepilin peptidase [Candidatus Woesearchaeota archaeon]